MKTYLIGYDLNKTGQDYKELISGIKNLAVYTWHCLDSTWLIKSDLTAVEIRNALKPLVDTNDDLLVARLSGETAWVGFKGNCSQWLRDNLA